MYAGSSFIFNISGETKKSFTLNGQLIVAISFPTGHISATNSLPKNAKVSPFSTIIFSGE